MRIAEDVENSIADLKVMVCSFWKIDGEFLNKWSIGLSHTWRFSFRVYAQERMDKNKYTKMSTRMFIAGLLMIAKKETIQMSI